MSRLGLTAWVATLLATITVLGCGALREDIIRVDAADEVHSTPAGLMTGWTERIVSTPGPILDRRHKKQDIAWLGYNRFANLVR
jgi:hypothetical protein